MGDVYLNQSDHLKIEMKGWDRDPLLGPMGCVCHCQSVNRGCGLWAVGSVCITNSKLKMKTFNVLAC